MSFSLRSSAFEQGGTIPTRCTGDGADVNPPLEWTGAPAGTESFAIIADDPDAPDPAHPKRTWVHWLVCDLPAAASSLQEGATRRAMPAGSIEGKNDSGGLGYEGPYPPIGRHRYFFKLYALDSTLGLREGFSRSDLARAMDDHVLGVAELMGMYQKSGA